MQDEEITLETIHESLINGNRDQAYDQIMEYGYHKFFKDFKENMESAGWKNKHILKHYSDMVNLFIARIQL